MISIVPKLTMADTLDPITRDEYRLITLARILRSRAAKRDPG